MPNALANETSPYLRQHQDNPVEWLPWGDEALYMEAVQAMTGHGGWPLNVFVTPEQVPFYGGTYFPPEPRHGMPSWQSVLIAVDDAWENRRDEIRASSERVVERLKGGA